MARGWWPICQPVTKRCPNTTSPLLPRSAVSTRTESCMDLDLAGRHPQERAGLEGRGTAPFCLTSGTQSSRSNPHTVRTTALRAGSAERARGLHICLAADNPTGAGAHHHFPHPFSQSHNNPAAMCSMAILLCPLADIIVARTRSHGANTSQLVAVRPDLPEGVASRDHCLGTADCRVIGRRSERLPERLSAVAWRRSPWQRTRPSRPRRSTAPRPRGPGRAPPKPRWCHCPRASRRSPAHSASACGRC